MSNAITLQHLELLSPERRDLIPEGASEKDIKAKIRGVLNKGNLSNIANEFQGKIRGALSIEHIVLFSNFFTHGGGFENFLDHHIGHPIFKISAEVLSVLHKKFNFTSKEELLQAGELLKDFSLWHTEQVEMQVLGHFEIDKIEDFVELCQKIKRFERKNLLQKILPLFLKGEIDEFHSFLEDPHINQYLALLRYNLGEFCIFFQCKNHIEFCEIVNNTKVMYIWAYLYNMKGQSHFISFLQQCKIQNKEDLLKFIDGGESRLEEKVAHFYIDELPEFLKYLGVDFGQLFSSKLWKREDYKIYTKENEDEALNDTMFTIQIKGIGELRSLGRLRDYFQENGITSIDDEQTFWDFYRREFDLWYPENKNDEMTFPHVKFGNTFYQFPLKSLEEFEEGIKRSKE